MTKYLIRTLLLTFSLAVFGVSLSHALTLNEAQKLLASDGEEGDNFGYSVSISGDTVVIGANGDDDKGEFSGSAYVFVRDGTGFWREQQKLTASDGDAFDTFGWSVSLSGDTAVIGASNFNGNGPGSVYVFVRDDTGIWQERQKLLAGDSAAGDRFGWTVSNSGDTVVIGSSRSGSAYVFVRDSTGLWREQQKLTASDGVADDRFGWTVSNSGNTVVIGSSRSGSAYVFVRDSTGLWREQQKLTASDGVTEDEFGWSVSLSGDMVVIGATGDSDNGFFSGSAYVFVRDSTGLWREQQKLTTSDGVEDDNFGWSVSLSGDTALIAIRNIGIEDESAYVFVRDGTGLWREQQKLTASDGEMFDEFGWSVSLSEDTAVIGAYGNGDNGNVSGSAYIFKTSDPKNDLLTIKKMINHRARPTPDTAAQLLAGSRYRANYKVTNNGPDRLYPVQVFEDGELVCNMYALNPGKSKQRYNCGSDQTVLIGPNNVAATVTAKVSSSNQELISHTDAYYTGLTNMPGKLKVMHYVNDNNADTQAKAVLVNGNQVEVLFRVENTGNIELYRVNTFYDPASPVNSGWQQQCFFGTMTPGQVRYCKRAISVTQAGLNKAFGRVQGKDANVGSARFVNASNPIYLNVVLP